jgi:pimeloyl-ACP methyl ester carboxylesterase
MLKRRSLKAIFIFSLVFPPLLFAASAQAEMVKLKNGLNMFYKTAGTGKIPVVLVHGYSFSSASWDKVLGIFPAQYKVYAMDLRGFGQTDKPVQGYSYAQVSEDIAQLMDALKIDKAVVIGHSMGGMIVQHFAVLYPAKVKALVLSNTYAMNAPPVGINESVKQRIAGYGTAEQNREVFKKVHPLYFSKDNLAPGDLDVFMKISLQASTKALQEMLKTIYATPQIPPEKYGAIKAPTLINVTTRDVFGTFDKAVKINEGIKKSKITVIEYCGHTPMWEKPKTWVAQVASFLKSRGVK